MLVENELVSFDHISYERYLNFNILGILPGN